jgi:hypothetical protein
VRINPRRNDVATVAEERKRDCEIEVIRALNLVEALLTGWVLEHDREEIAKLTAPLYDLVAR